MGYPTPTQASVVLRDASSGGTNVYVVLRNSEFVLASENANNATSTFSFTHPDGGTDYFPVYDSSSIGGELKGSQVFVDETKLATEFPLVSTTACAKDVLVRSARGCALRIVYKASPGSLALTFDDDGGTEGNRLQASLTGTNAHTTILTSAHGLPYPVL